MKVDPDHWILLCARQYVKTLRQFRLAVTADEQQRTRKHLHYLADSAEHELRAERSMRERRTPKDVQTYLNDKNQTLARRLSESEAEAVRHFFAIPPVKTMENISGAEMLSLADLFEGWAQNPSQSSFNMAKCFGWADGMRALVVAIGADYEPPDKASGEPDSLIKFIAKKIKATTDVQEQ